MPARRFRRFSSIDGSNIEFHDGGYKLEGVADYYFVTHDAELVRNTRELWQPEIDHIVKSLDPKTGLAAARKVLQRHRYAGHFDQRQCELLAGIARYGAGARRPG